MSSKKGNLKNVLWTCHTILKDFITKKMVVIIMTKICGVSRTMVAKLKVRLERLHEGNARTIT